MDPQGQTPRSHQRQKSPQLKIEVFLEEPERTQNGLFLLASALVTLGQKTEKNRAIQFFLDGLPYGNVSRTDGNGRVAEKIRIPDDSKRISVSAQVIGERAHDRKIADIPQQPAKTKPIPSSLKVEANGSNGKYALSVFVADKEEKPVKQVPVIFAPEDDFMNHVKALTNDNGTVIQSVTINSMERFMVVMVEGTKLTERIHLFGPVSRPAEAVNERSVVLYAR